MSTTSETMMAEPKHSATPADPEGRFWGSFYRGLFLAWTVIIYLGTAIVLIDTYTNNSAATWGWPLGGLIALLAAYFALYHWYFLQRLDQCSPRWHIVLYGVAQLAVVLLLAQYNLGFVSLLYVVLAHLLATLPYRAWPLPIVTALLVVYFFWGVHSNIVSGNWDDAFYTMLQPVTWVVIIGSITIVIRQSYQQTQTVYELRRARAQLEASAAQAEELAVLRERARLAREFHDNLGHALVLVNVKLEAAQRLYGRERARGDAELEATRELVRETMAELRRSLADLRAPLTTHHDLAAVLQQLADQTSSRSRLHIDVELAPDPPELEPQQAEALWRIAREALANIERHAGAASVTLSLQRRGDALLLRIADDGIGIDAAERSPTGHYGLVGMRERVESLGGTFSIGAGASGGTIVEAVVGGASTPAQAAHDATRAEHAQDAAGGEQRQNAARAADT